MNCLSKRFATLGGAQKLVCPIDKSRSCVPPSALRLIMPGELTALFRLLLLGCLEDAFQRSANPMRAAIAVPEFPLRWRTFRGAAT